MTLDERSTSVRLLTPSGAGGVAVIRLEGKRSGVILSTAFKPSRSAIDLTRLDPGTLVYGEFLDADEVVDDGIVCSRVDDLGCCVIDFSVHGGVRSVERLMILIQRLGAEFHRGGEAVVASTIEAAADAALCRARTRLAVRLIARQRAVLPVALKALADTLERDGVQGREELSRMLDRSRGVLSIFEGAKVGLFGPANAGKSTLMHRLVDSANSVVSDVTGTTRDWVSADGAIDGVPVRWIDTAGVRALEDGEDGASTDVDGLELEAVSRGLEQFRHCGVHLIVLDGSIAFPSGPMNFFSRYQSEWDVSRAVFVRNKSDLGARWGETQLVEQVAECGQPVRFVTVSGRTGSGISELRSAILEKLRSECESLEGAFFFTLAQIERFSAILSDGSDLEVVASLRNAAQLKHEIPLY